jgi:hypothetical protein
VHGRKFRNVETIREDSIRLSLQKMFALVGSDVGYGCKNIARVCRSTLNAVSMIDSTFSSLCIYIKVLQIIIKIDGAGAEVSSKKSCVGSKNRGYIDPALLAEGKSYTGKPFVEVCNDGLFFLVINELPELVFGHEFQLQLPTSPKNQATKYPNTTASLVSSSPGGDGIPAVAHKSAFHSSRNR